MTGVGRLRVDSFPPDGKEMAAFERVQGVVPAHPEHGPTGSAARPSGRAEPALARREAGPPTRSHSAEPVSPTATCLLARRGDRPVARLSLQVAEELEGAPGRSGLIGHYEALDAEAGVALLVDGRQRLGEQGVARVLGPINGSTWMRYRLALPSRPEDPSFEHPVFFGEPVNPFDYPDHFEAAGFTIAARYESRVDRNVGVAAPEADQIEERLAARGITVRALDLDRFDEELPALYQASLAAFAGNLYYTPIDFASFRAIYQRARALVDPDFVLLAVDAGRHVQAFQFAFPDPLSVEAGRATRIVVKTVATVPEARGIGLGNWLLDRIRRRAFERGYRAVIHALMHVSNFSMSMSARHASEVFRRYALYAWSP